MIDIKLTIEGTTPLLCHRFTDAAQLKATSGSRSSIANDSTPAHEEAEASLYTDEEGRVGIPGPNLLRCFIDAGKFYKVGRSKMTTQKSSLIPAAVIMTGIFLPIISEGGWRVDTRPVRIPATGGRILRHRACFEDWKISSTMSLNTDVISAKLLREVVDTAGTHIGLGDFRPDTKGPFGRFVVTLWK